jgi:hypothetical protein
MNCWLLCLKFCILAIVSFSQKFVIAGWIWTCVLLSPFKRCRGDQSNAKDIPSSPMHATAWKENKGTLYLASALQISICWGRNLTLSSTLYHSLFAATKTSKQGKRSIRATCMQCKFHPARIQN